MAFGVNAKGRIGFTIARDRVMTRHHKRMEL